MSQAWRVQHVRVTAFPKPGSAFRKTGLWQQFFDSDPERASTQPLGGKESGPFADGTLTLSSQAIRIDLRHTPTQEAELAQQGFASLGQYPTALEPLVTLTRERAARALPPLSRLAFGAMLIRPTASRSEAFDELRKTLDFAPHGDSADDFLYQINYPRSSTAIRTLHLNRLSKWSVAAVQSLIVTSTSAQAAFGEKSFACALELDISSEANFTGTIEPNQIGALLNELVAGGHEIVTEWTTLVKSGVQGTSR